MAFKDFVKTVKSEAGDAVEVTKLKAKISKEKANIKETYEAIGEIFYNKVKEGVFHCNTIDVSLSSISGSIGIR